MLTEKEQKSSKNYYCKNCNYNTSRKSQYERHLITQKHKYLQNTDAEPSKKKYICQCGREYKYRQSLYNHRKTCKGENKDDMKQLVLKLITENEELKN